MVKVARFPSELNDVADFQRGNIRLFGVGTRALVPNKEVIKEFHPGPGSGAVVGGYVKPPCDGCVIHDPAARVNALRSEIRAIAADPVEIQVCGVAAVSPFSRVEKRGFSVIIHDRHALYICAGIKTSAYRAAALLFAHKYGIVGQRRRRLWFFIR